MEPQATAVEGVLRHRVQHRHQLVGGAAGATQQVAVLTAWQQHIVNVLQQHNQRGKGLAPCLYLPERMTKPVYSIVTCHK